MPEELDNKSKELLASQNPPQHVERRQRIFDPDRMLDGEPLPKSPEDEALDQPDMYTQIEQKAQEVEGLAEVVEYQIAAKLKNYTVEVVKNELLDAEYRLFGTRTGIITYPMYRTCLAIIGQQSQDFAGKVMITPEKILEAVGGNLTNAFTPEGISKFLEGNSLLKNGVMNFEDFAPLQDNNIDDQNVDMIKKLVGMVLDVIDPSGAIKKTAEAMGAKF